MSRRSRPVHVRACEADALGLKVAFQIKSGQFHEALGSLNHFIKCKRAGHSDFAEYASFDEIPLGLACDLNQKDLGFWEDAGLHTAGDIERLSEAELIAIRGSGVNRVRAIRAAIAALKREWKAWRRLHSEGQGGGANCL